jgi:hypothetical protein
MAATQKIDFVATSAVKVIALLVLLSRRTGG